MSDGRPLAWKQPLTVNFRVREAGAGLIVHKLDCTSSFLHVEGSGTAQQFTAAADFDLARLANELARFADLAAYELAGTGQAHLTCQTDAAGQLKATRRRRRPRFCARRSLAHALARAAFHRGAEATGSLSEGSLKQLAIASLRVTTQSDQLDGAIDPSGRQSGRNALPLGNQLARRFGGAAATPLALVRSDGLGAEGPGKPASHATVSAAAVDSQQAKGAIRTFASLGPWAVHRRTGD